MTNRSGYDEDHWTDYAVGALVAAAWAVALVLLIGGTLLLAMRTKAQARDQGQWENSDPAIAEWYSELKMPDNPSMRCCGQADAYYADKVYAKDGKSIAVITDTRPDAPLGRSHVPPGTEIVIPNHKMKWDRGNPTGHNVIFLSNPNDEGLRDVYCFVDGTEG